MPLYTPIAAPREPRGAKRDTIEGRLASSRLNAQKNTASPVTIVASDERAAARISSEATSAAIAPMSTALPRPGRSTLRNSGSTTPTDTTSTGR